MALVVTGFPGLMPHIRGCFKPTNYMETLQIRSRGSDQPTLELSDPYTCFLLSLMGVTHPVLFSGWFGDWQDREESLLQK